MAKSLKISIADAKQAIAVLQIQGYVKEDGSYSWLTTLAGESVSGSKTPRFALGSVEEALTSLLKHIKSINADSKSEFKITEAVAFGDFLHGETRVQAPDIGIQLARRQTAVDAAGSAIEHAAERALLRKLKGKSPILDIQRYQTWMSDRSHRRLL